MDPKDRQREDAEKMEEVREPARGLEDDPDAFIDDDSFPPDEGWDQDEP